MVCANYQPVTRMDRMLTFFGVEREAGEIPSEVFPTGLAPFVRLAEPGSGNKVVEAGAFGLLPFFAKEVAYGRRTYNARSETVAKLASFRDAWKRSQRCVIPAESIYEPCWETGKAVRWRISQVANVPMGIAGIYTRWKHPETGELLFSFAMLTVNADDHRVMKRFHRPGDEKRMVVILDPADYDRWLGCDVDQASAFFQRWMGELVTVAAPLTRAPRTVSGRVVVPPPPKVDPASGDLF